MRYIDADALIKKMFPIGIGDGKYTINAKAVRFAIDNAPTADVAPRSEVERLNKELDELAEEHSDLIVEKDQLFDEVERLYYNLQAVLEERAETKREIAMEIFEEIERLIKITAFADCWSEGGFKDDIAELKKKYAEGDDPK